MEFKPDIKDAVDRNCLTQAFKENRQYVIDNLNSENSDAVIRQFIDHYGTHFIRVAYLGGFLDYFYSCTTSCIDEYMDIDVVLAAGDKAKFGISGSVDVKIKDQFESMSEEKIEKFSVKGGNAVELANKVAAGKSGPADIKKWHTEMVKNKQYELLSFKLEPISVLFSLPHRREIENYMRRMYYSDISITRSE